ncbi:MAG: hypothetical protein K9L61_02670 [Candidatus Omnitrophica bacterium]|nr:hypothetical protein [Candidatus Omnitrophota bacterium]
MKKVINSTLISAIVLFSVIFSVYSQPFSNPNLKIKFNSWNNILIQEPVKTSPSNALDKKKLKMTLSSLVDPKGFLHLAYTGNDLAMVIISEDWVKSSDFDKNKDVDEIISLLKEFGFKQIIVKQECMACSQMPTLRQE